MPLDEFVSLQMLLWEYMSRNTCVMHQTDLILVFYSELLEDLERSPHAAAIAECFVERVSTCLSKIYISSCSFHTMHVSQDKDIVF